MSDTPTPGSDEAIALGCRCPSIDNGHGRGRGGDGKKYGWFINENCPLHGKDHLYDTGKPMGDGNG